MAKLLIEGGNRLKGEVTVQGSKNSTLPILAATVATGDESILYNCPCLSDVDSAIKILRYLGCSATRSGHNLTVDTRNITCDHIPDSLMREMRSSIIFLGAILSRCSKARVTFPGGCELGARPIDLHLDAFRRMGVTIREHHGDIICYAEKALQGANIALAFPSVGATENIIIAAVRAKGTTVITNAAREPEIEDLCAYLNSCGACIRGAGEGTIVIEGVEELHGTAHTIIPDRIVAATLMSAAAVTGSDIVLRGVVSSHLSSVIPLFEEAGCDISIKEGTMSISAPKRLRAFPMIRTTPYPGFPTDAQAPLMAVATVAQGTTVFVENIFENRYKHAGELTRLGARVKTEGRVAVVEGVRELYSSSLQAYDLRGSASLAVAAMAAQGVTVIDTTKYLERGYEDFDGTLRNLGANVKMI